MEIPRLFRLLRNDVQRREQQVDALESALSAVIGLVGEELPQKKPELDQISAQLGNNLNKLRAALGNTFEYFSGKGVVANRMREHILMTQWLYTNMEVPKAVADQLISEMMSKLAVFDFKPRNDAVSVNTDIEFFNRAIQRVRTGYFGSPMPSIEATEHGVEHFQTGIYGNPGSGDALTLVLRVGQPGQGQMQSIFLASPGASPMIWHHHPWEDYWLCPRNFEVTFEGLVEKMAEQLELALKGAGGEAMDRTGEEVLEELNSHAHAIFDSELLLPGKIITAAGEAIYIAYNDLQSEILARVPGYILSFMNTKGEYAVRSGPRIFSAFGPAEAHQTVNWKDIPADHQHALVTKARATIATLTAKINEASAAGSAPENRVSASSYYQQFHLPEGARN